MKQEYGLKKFYVSRIKSEPEKSLPVYETGMMLEELAFQPTSPARGTTAKLHNFYAVHTQNCSMLLHLPS